MSSTSADIERVAAATGVLTSGFRSRRRKLYRSVGVIERIRMSPSPTR